jgi:hypothetical protein
VISLTLRATEPALWMPPVPTSEMDSAP